MSTTIYDKRKRCAVCLKDFWAARRNATYCSDTCRQRAHRKPSLEKRIKEFYDDAHSAIMSLAAVSDRGFEGYRAQKCLQTLMLQMIEAMPDQSRRTLYQQLETDFYRLRDSSMSRNRPENDGGSR